MSARPHSELVDPVVGAGDGLGCSERAAGGVAAPIAGDAQDVRMHVPPHVVRCAEASPAVAALDHEPPHVDGVFLPGIAPAGGGLVLA